MTKCGYCGSRIFMGGVRAGDQRYCNKKCHQNAYILSVTKNVPTDVIERKVEELWRGTCPKCRSLGPVDVHKIYEVYSILILTRWTTRSQLSCRSCATKRQFGGIVFSFFCGWWGFPWGLILTPVQIARDIAGMSRGPNASRPSDDLRKLVIVNLGAQMMAAQKSTTTVPG